MCSVQGRYIDSEVDKGGKFPELEEILASSGFP